MADMELEGGRLREELLERVELMEAMIAEGRRTTGRYGWIFVMWGLVYVVASLWATYLPHGAWAWPVCVAIAVTVHVVDGRRRACPPPGSRSRNIVSVWRALGISIAGFCLATIATHHAGGAAYVAAIFFFIGMAHGASGMILRWPPQIALAVLWWGCGVASQFVTGQVSLWLFVGASCGMIFFGMYAMMKESQRAAQQEGHHA